MFKPFQMFPLLVVESSLFFAKTVRSIQKKLCHFDFVGRTRDWKNHEEPSVLRS